MYLTKKHLSRRTVLRGAGVAIGLPLLDAMVPAATALAQTAAAPKLRAGFFYIPHGAIMWNTAFGAEMDRWTPSGAGEDFTLSPILEPLENYKHMVTSFGHLENKAPAGSVHGLFPATWLSGIRPDEEATGAHMAPTIDQMIAAEIGQETVLPSLEVASETTIQSAAGGSYYSSTLAFRDAMTPLPMEFNPRKVFIQLFGAGDTQDERDLIASRTASILDAVNGRANELKATLGAEDRNVLDNYLDSVRETERRLEIASQRDLSDVDLPEAPIGELPDFNAQVRIMFDLIAFAYQIDVTRVATYIMAGEATARTYNHVGVPDAFHPLSHHANNLQRLEKLVVIQRYHVERFAEFIDRLAQMPDGENSVLENSMFLYGSNMSNSDRHNNYPLPTLLVGGGAGRLQQGGQHIDLPERTTHSNLLLTMVNKAGLELTSLSDSTGEIAGV